MELKNYNVYFFFAVLILIAIVTFFVIKPFFIPFILAAILAHAFYPVHKFFLKIFKFKGLSAALTCLLIGLIIFLPLLAVFAIVANEVQGVVYNFTYHPSEAQNLVQGIADRLATLPLLKEIKQENILSPAAIAAWVKNLSGYLLPVFQFTYNGIGHFLFASLIMFFSLFYLLLDGEKLVKKIMFFSPIRNKYESVIIKKFNQISQSTIKGQAVLGLVHGLLGGLIFWVAGVNSPVLLAIVMAILGVIPFIGTAIVWLPTALIMLALGNYIDGIIILIFGFLIISTLDSIIGPRIMGRGSKMHPLLALLSAVGGIYLFGIAGLVVGPFFAALFIILLDIYAVEFKDQIQEYNL